MFTDSYNFNFDKFRLTPTKNATLKGLLKAKPTGRIISNVFVEVIVDGMTIPARPCFSVGGFAFVPTEEFLTKYKDEIFLWVVFEEENIRKCVVLGWCFNKGKETDLGDNWPNDAFFRTVKFREEFNDVTETYTMQHRDSGDYYQFGVKGVAYKIQEWFSDIIGKWRVKSKTAVIESSDIRLTGENVQQSGVRGDDLNENLKELISQLSSLCSAVQTQCNVLSSTARASGPTAPLSGGFQALSVQAGAIKAKVSAINGKLAKHLSKKIKLD